MTCRRTFTFHFFAIVGLICSALTAPLPAKTLDTCFSPKGHCDQVLISWINSSLKSMDAAIYGLTDPTIAQALVRAHRRGVKIRVVRDKVQAAGRKDVTRLLQNVGIPVRIQRGSRGGSLHHKFLIIDGRYVITGSFNWTHNARSKNDENFVVVDDQAPKFKKEFNRLWELSVSLPAGHRTDALMDDGLAPQK